MSAYLARYSTGRSSQSSQTSLCRSCVVECCLRSHRTLEVAASYPFTVHPSGGGGLSVPQVHTRPRHFHPMTTAPRFNHLDCTSEVPDSDTDCCSGLGVTKVGAIGLYRLLVTPPRPVDHPCLRGYGYGRGFDPCSVTISR